MMTKRVTTAFEGTTFKLSEGTLVTRFEEGKIIGVLTESPHGQYRATNPFTGEPSRYRLAESARINLTPGPTFAQGHRSDSSNQQVVDMFKKYGIVPVRRRSRAPSATL